MKIEQIEPHGLCAGVNAAIAKALKLQNVYCLHELVHNEIVIEELKALGYRFVETVEEVPEGETVVLPAHGVAPDVYSKVKERNLAFVDTTCPFVEKVHREARLFSAKGLPVVIVGDRNHAEVKGLVGEVGRAAVWNPRNEGMAAISFEKGARIGVVSQTTMNAEDVKSAVARLRKTYEVVSCADVCLATRDRQQAVRNFCGACRKRHVLQRSFGVLVLGSSTSANCRRLAEIAGSEGARVFTAGSMDELRKIDFGDLATLGVTSGASTPERFYDEAIKFLRHVPRHVAIIMDGNGRWATGRGKRRSEGHLAGAKTLSRVLEWCGEKGIRYLTVYAFSTENWKRPKDEVECLMNLFVKMLKSKALDLTRGKVRFRMIGRRGDLSAKLLREIERLEERTKGFEREFVVAISYGGRAEIIDAANAAIARGERVTEETFRQFLYAPDVPDPDLIIRTSGECRTSNFLLWESAYSEYYFTDVLWPDFSEADLDGALAAYARRNRRRGGV